MNISEKIYMDKIETDKSKQVSFCLHVTERIVLDDGEKKYHLGIIGGGCDKTTLRNQLNGMRPVEEPFDISPDELAKSNTIDFDPLLDQMPTVIVNPPFNENHVMAYRGMSNVSSMLNEMMLMCPEPDFFDKRPEPRNNPVYAPKNVMHRKKFSNRP